MKNTGERHILNEDIKDEAEYYNHLMHLATYQFALKYVKGKRVLDYGCGSGYGSHLLSSKADNVIGVDISKETIDFAKNYFHANNLGFKTIFELSDEKFDIITSFQVIEHVPHDKEYIKKLKSLLNSGGCILISTPDKKDRLFNYIQRPWNIFHLKEYSVNSLNKLLIKHFTKVEILKIGSKADFVLKEIARTKKQRIITLPCTLFFYPNFLRVFLINFQIKIYKSIIKIRKNKKLSKTDSINLHNDFKIKYSAEDIEINNNITTSTSLLAICFNN